MSLRAWLNRFWAEMNEMPGPVWLFGAWAVLRLAKWVPGVGSSCSFFGAGDCASMWIGIGMFVGMLLGQILPFAALWLLMRRKPIAVSLTSFYVAMRALGLCILFILPLLRNVPEWACGASGPWGDQLPMQLFECVLWLAFMVYLERSQDIARLFPEQQQRRAPWWLMLVVAVLVVVFTF